jgi:uncharacterized protein YihD (DUF1040 family)
MTNRKKNAIVIKSELESEIFATVNTILNLNQKYQKGILKETFFQRSIKSATNDLLELNLSLNKHNIDLSKTLNHMNFTDDYYKAIDIINKISSLNFSNSQFSESISSSILEIPGISSEITASFITLIDALKLDGFDNNELIFGLFKDLKKNFDRFPGLELDKIKLEKIFEEVLQNEEKIVNNKNYRDSLADDLYAVFNFFQKKLNLGK